MKRILEVLNSDEPDYSSISDILNEKDYPTLDELITQAPVHIATKAIICLGLISSESSINSIAMAANNHNPVLRIAAAQALIRIKGIKTNLIAAQTIAKLLDDDDLGVRKFALKAASASRLLNLKEKVLKICTNERNDEIKKIAQNVLKELELK